MHVLYSIKATLSRKNIYLSFSFILIFKAKTDELKEQLILQNIFFENN